MTPPTAPATRCAAIAEAGHVRWSSRGRCSRPCPAGSPSTTSPSTSRPARSTCPNGVTRRDHREPQRHVRRRPAAAAHCASRCTTAQGGRTLHLHPHDALLREHRRRANDPALAGRYRQHRPMVERSIAWLDRGREPQGPLPRRQQEQRLAAHPRRRPEPAPTAQPRPDPTRRSLAPWPLPEDGPVPPTASSRHEPLGPLTRSQTPLKPGRGGVTLCRPQGLTSTMRRERRGHPAFNPCSAPS